MLLYSVSLAVMFLAVLVMDGSHGRMPLLHGKRAASQQLRSGSASSASPFGTSLHRPSESDILAGYPPLPASLPIREGLALPSCKYLSVTAECLPTHAFLLRGDTEWENTTFAGRALAFTVAASAYCSQFDLDSTQCSYPCMSNGEVCALTGALAYGLYACPGSQAEQDMYCTLADQADPTLCNKTPACQQVHIAGQGTQCTARFKANMTTAQFMQYLADWGTTRRNVWGCCSGSNAKWINSVYCDRFSSAPQECAAHHGCEFSSGGTCSWSTDAWLDANLGPGSTTHTLKDMARQCAGIKDQHECTMHSPVEVRRDLTQGILRFDLASINTPVPDSECVVWEAAETLARS